eukprot:658207-Rhodomonas_salina.1
MPQTTRECGMGVIDRIAQTTTGMGTMLETGSMQCKQCAQTNVNLFGVNWPKKTGRIAPVKTNYEQQYFELKEEHTNKTKTLEDMLNAARNYGAEMATEFQGM